MNPHQDLLRGIDAGWVFFPHLLAGTTDRHGALLELASSLGRATPARSSSQTIIEELIPTRRSQAQTNSLSAQHGLGDFPYHTDTAHWPTPSRYTIMCCEVPGNEYSTALIHVRQLLLSNREVDLLCRALFLVRNSNKSFYTSILDRHRPFFRFDAGCMEPTNKEAINALGILKGRLHGANPTNIRWETGDVVVIDNWHALHARLSTFSITNSHRTLLRVQVQQDRGKS